MKWRMMMIFGLVSLISMSAAKAESDDVRFAPTSRLISYELLMRLKPENRKLYMQELRILLMEMEDLQNFRGQVDPQLYRRMNSRLDLLSVFVDEANAAGANAPMSCRPPLMLWRGSDRKYYCVDTDLGRRLSPSQPRRGDGSMLMRSGVNPMASLVPNAFTDPNRKFCSINDRYSFPLNLGTGTGTGTARPTRAPAPAPQPRATQPREPQARVATSSDRRGVDSRTPAAAPVRRPSARVETPRPGVAPQAVRRTPFDPGEVTNIPDIQAVESCAATDADIPVKTGLKCDGPRIMEARRDFRGPDHSTCVYAGHLRRYRNNEAAPGQCQPITRWCVNNSNPEDCQVPTDPAHHFTPVFSCPANQVLCSPLLFGVRMRHAAHGQQRFESYCVSRGQNATRQCYEMVSAEPVQGDERVQREGIEHVDLLNQDGARANYLSAVLEPEDRDLLATMNAQLQPMYQALARDLTNMCINDGKERQVFCQECYYIRERLSQMAYIADGKTTSSCLKISVGTLSNVAASTDSVAAPVPPVAEVLPGDARVEASFTVNPPRREGGLPPPPAPRVPGSVSR